MSSKFCSLDEAFAGPSVPVKKEKEKKRDKEKRSEAPPEPKAPAFTQASKPEATSSSFNFFPLPGETADSEEWDKAFTLEGSNLPRPDNSPHVANKQSQKPTQIVEPEEWATSFQMGSRPDNSVPVAGRSTLWREIPTVQNPPSSFTSDINHRLDELARKLETFTTGSPMQSTAELFLFVAIGLIFLLAIDTLLRFATNIALATKRGGYRSMYGRRLR